MRLDNPGYCKYCGKPFAHTDNPVSSITNTRDDAARQYWHQACWLKHQADVEQANQSN